MHVQPDRDRVVVTVAGELDIATVGDLDRVVRDLPRTLELTGTRQRFGWTTV